MKKQIQFEKEINWLLKEKYKNNPNKNFLKDVKRIEKGEPVDYVIGFVEFLGCRIDLSKKTLIPRKETEFWTAIAIDKIKNNKFSAGKKSINCLDIFSGSGCVGIAVLSNINSEILKSKSGKVNSLLCDFIDRETKSISQIKFNLKNSLLKSNSYKVIKSDIFEKINKKYDFIFANPPYIPIIKKSKIQKSVLMYEPKEALFGGKDGMSFIKKFLKDAKRHLLKDGKIFMEFDSPQKKEIEKLLKKNKYNSWEFFKDQYGKWRWVEIQ